MKITKILVAISFLFATVTANAGTLNVTGNMQATYHTDSDATTGNPLGMDRELKFSGSTELDNGMTVSVMQDTTDALGFGDGKITFGNVLGLLEVSLGADGSPIDAIDDVTPNAFEEANGAGSGAYVDITGGAAQMGLGIAGDSPIGKIAFKYVPKADSTENADKAGSGDANASVGETTEITIVSDMGDLAGITGLTTRIGYAEKEPAVLKATDDGVEATVAANYTTGPISLGYQKKYNNKGMTAAGQDAIFYKDDVMGVAYAINDSLSVSLNRMTSHRHSNQEQGTGTATANKDQSTDAVSIGYTVGGMTIGFQHAETDNKGYVSGVDDDTNTLSLVVAF